LDELEEGLDLVADPPPAAALSDILG
jgi:hypothetical protein